MSTGNESRSVRDIAADLQKQVAEHGGKFGDYRASVWKEAADALLASSESRAPVSDMLRDALRYRWLVNKRISGVGVPFLAAFSRRSQSLEQCQDSSDDIDAAIDREMEAYRG